MGAKLLQSFRLALRYKEVASIQIRWELRSLAVRANPAKSYFHLLSQGGINFALPPTISCGRVRSARRRVDHRGPDQLPRRSGGVGRTRGHELENAFG